MVVTLAQAILAQAMLEKSSEVFVGIAIMLVQAMLERVQRFLSAVRSSWLKPSVAQAILAQAMLEIVQKFLYESRSFGLKRFRKGSEVLVRLVIMLAQAALAQAILAQALLSKFRTFSFSNFDKF